MATYLTTGDTNLHLEPLLHGGSALEVLDAGRDVLLNALLREVDHVGREEGDAVLLEELLVLVEHTVEPRQKLLGAVVGCLGVSNWLGREGGGLRGRGDGLWRTTGTP